ncbi:retrovirus-related pol polyprotein from [Plakobranchus ocellatus]|uniref:Retrovirus-related pol polyprotein from n=1 Tax=Plakobranchus ocellatus TaxID=259542 RepID=A0AAV4AIS1_9GAST|nr:retrovirus-related pol polyprotein from [Plakobranchus ocellatus]
MKESLFRDRLVTGIRKPETRKKLLERRKLTLQDAVDICTATESSVSQIKDMDHKHTSPKTVHKIVNKPARHATLRLKPAQATCKFCGGQHPFPKSKCLAYGKTCSKCPHISLRSAREVRRSITKPLPKSETWRLTLNRPMTWSMQSKAQ